jgi:type II secretory pathway component PulM
MKEWWLNLSLREKQAIALGAFLLGLFLIYEMIFASLFNATTALREKIHKNQTLLSWMKDGDTRLQELQNSHTVTTTNDSSSLLSRIQNDLKHTPLQKNVLQLQQADNDSFEMHLQQVSFDNMMSWLIKLCGTQQLTITDMFIKPSGDAGIVDATLKLKHA